MRALPRGLWNWEKLQGGVQGGAWLGVNTVHSMEHMRAQRCKGFWVMPPVMPSRLGTRTLGSVSSLLPLVSLLLPLFP